MSAAPPASWMERDWSCKKAEEFCRSCGRQLVLTEEPGQFNRETGQREVERWHSCPRYLVSPWKVVFLSGYGYGHESHNADNPMFARQWR